MQIPNLIWLTGCLILLWLPGTGVANDTQATTDQRATNNTEPLDNSTLQSGFQLIAKVESEIKPDTPVVLQLALRNTTDKTLVRGESWPEKQFNLDIKDDRGANMPLTRYSEELKVREPLGIASVKVDPSQELTYNLVISRMYDLTMSGTYTLTATTYVRRQDGKAKIELKSNPVRFTILRGDSSYRIADPPHAFYPKGVQPPPPDLTPELVTGQALTWKVNNSWPLEVELYTEVTPSAIGIPQTITPKPEVDTAPQDKKYVLVGRYAMQVRVAGSDRMEGQECWMVDFIPAPDAPSTMGRELYRVWVGKQDGLAHRIVSLKNTFNPPLRKFKGIALPDAQIVGFPIEFLPINVQKVEDLVPNGHLFSMTTEATNAQAVVQARLKVGDKDRFVIKQTWPQGAKWWSEYEKQDYNNHTILKAKLLAE